MKVVEIVLPRIAVAMPLINKCISDLSLEGHQDLFIIINARHTEVSTTMFIKNLYFSLSSFKNVEKIMFSGTLPVIETAMSEITVLKAKLADFSKKDIDELGLVLKAATAIEMDAEGPYVKTCYTFDSIEDLAVMILSQGYKKVTED